MRSAQSEGVVRSDEAYSKQELMRRLEISQRFWDKMVAAGLPWANIGHSKWVRGAWVIEYLERSAVVREPTRVDSE